MSTVSQDIIDRAAKYTFIERVTDSLGRVIGVRRLRPSEQAKLQELTPNLDGEVEIDAEIAIKDENGKDTGEKRLETIKVGKRLPLAAAAAVTEIDDVRIPFPTNRGQLDSILDRLDDEGLTAAYSALGKLNRLVPEAKVEDAKNSAATPA